MTSFEDIIASKVDGPVTSFIVAAAYLDENGNDMLFLDSGDNQATYISMGLIEFAKTFITKKFTEEIDFNN
jgi:hypothetical protein